MATTLYCETCPWEGEEDELVCTEADPDNFSHCPRCDGTSFHEEEEDEIDDDDIINDDDDEEDIDED